MDINDLDFGKLIEEIRKQDVEDITADVDAQIEQLRSANPMLHLFFVMGRMIGRAEIVKKLVDIVDTEARIADEFRKSVKK